MPHLGRKRAASDGKVSRPVFSTSTRTLVPSLTSQRTLPPGLGAILTTTVVEIHLSCSGSRSSIGKPPFSGLRGCCSCFLPPPPELVSVSVRIGAPLDPPPVSTYFICQMWLKWVEPFSVLGTYSDQEIR